MTPYLEHIKTYVIPIAAGKGELKNIQLPLEKQYMDRIVVFSNDIVESALNKFWVNLIHSGAELFGENTSARFFTANDAIAPKEKGFLFPFDVKCAKTYMNAAFTSLDTGVSGTIYMTIFYRDKPLLHTTIDTETVTH